MAGWCCLVSVCDFATVSGNRNGVILQPYGSKFTHKAVPRNRSTTAPLIEFLVQILLEAVCTKIHVIRYRRRVQLAAGSECAHRVGQRDEAHVTEGRRTDDRRRRLRGGKFPPTARHLVRVI